MKAFTRVVECVNAEGQPALVEGDSYVIVAEVECGKTWRNGEEKVVKGLMVMPEGETRALPYVYDRTRFSVISD